MKTIFKNDFSSSGLENWSIEQHVPNGYVSCRIKNNSMALLDVGDRFFPNVPCLKNFLLNAQFNTNWDVNKNKFSFQLYFGYDFKSKKSMALEVISDGKSLSIELNKMNFHHKEKIVDVIPHPKIFNDILKKQKIISSFELKNNKIILKLNEFECFSYQFEDLEVGAVAISRGNFSGDLLIEKFEILSDEELIEKVIWDKIKIPLVGINGIENTILWTVSAKQSGNIFILEIELSGGVKDRENIDWFLYHCRYMEKLQNPYLRIEDENFKQEFCLADGELVLTNPKENYFYSSIGHKKPEWPLRRKFFLSQLPQTPLLFAGYKNYYSVVNDYFSRGPGEAIFDTKLKQIIYTGEALEENSIQAKLKSPVDKLICKKIPKTTYDYRQALSFAQKNHFFFDSEDCVFYFELFSRIGNAKNELIIEYRLENAFLEPIEEYKQIDLAAESQMIALDIEKLYSEKIVFKGLPVAVYHLRFRIYWSKELIQQSYHAFEVNSEDENKKSAIANSNLPVFYSFLTEYMGIDTDAFDPWKKECSDIAHYASVGVSIMPHIAREKRLWELNKIYKREWFVYLTSRTVEDCSLENNIDLVKRCNYITLPNGMVYRIRSRANYRGYVLEILIEFAKRKNIPLQSGLNHNKLKLLDESNTVIALDTYEELVSEYWNEWVDFYCEQNQKRSKKIKSELKNYNPSIKISDYGPVSIYGGAYRSAYSMSIYGTGTNKEVADIYDGFYVYEDYPCACRYNLNRGTFLLATIKMILPQLIIYPEIYNTSEIDRPCPDAAVARAWPSGESRRAKDTAGLFCNRIYEYVFASAWHDGQNFNYWRDYGFSTSTWRKEKYETLLSIWSFLSKAKPCKPLKANAFVYSDKCYKAHGAIYEEYPGDTHVLLGDLYNTAEESLAFCYEMSRIAGQNAGFVVDLTSLNNLNANDIDTIILPPLTDVANEELQAIRKLHNQGVSLLGFEDVSGLEDLFGVEEKLEVQVNNIKVNQELTDNPLAGLSDLKEYTIHKACKGKYQSIGAKELLSAEIPVLFVNETKFGKTALFNIPPTVVRRQDQYNRVSAGRDSISKLINRSTQLIMKYLSNPAVEVSEGKVIAFKDTTGNTQIIVEQDSWPLDEKTIRPILTINIPNKKLVCSQDFSIISQDDKSIKIRLKLEGFQSAVFTLFN